MDHDRYHFKYKWTDTYFRNFKMLWTYLYYLFSLATTWNRFDCYSLHVHTWILFETWHLLVCRALWKNGTPYFFDNGDVDHLIKLLIAPVTVLSPLPDKSFFVGTSRSLAVLLCLKLVDGFNSLSSLIITRKWILHKHILLSQSVSHSSRLQNLFLVAERKCNQNWQELALHKIHDTITSILNFNDIHLYVNLNLNGICQKHVYVWFTVINYLFLSDIYETTTIFTFAYVID